MRLLEIFARRGAHALLCRANRQRFDAAVAAPLNWIYETRSLIEEEVRSFGESGYGRWVVTPSASSRNHFQVDLHSDQSYSKTLSCEELVREEPASLVYKLRPNGTIAVRVSGHGSAQLSSRVRPYIDLLAHPWDLAGQTGRAKVRQHLRDFGRLAIATRTASPPTVSTERFIRRMESRSDRFAPAFSTSSEARRHRLSGEANFSMGLVAGLIASTILPLAKDFGIEAGIAAKSTLAACTGPHSASRPSLVARCLADGNYDMNHLASVVLAAGPLVTFALALALVGLISIWRIQRIR